MSSFRQQQMLLSILAVASIVTMVTGCNMSLLSTVMSHGCQLTVWRSSVSTGNETLQRLWLEPAFCIPAGLLSRRGAEDPATMILADPIGGYSYINVPVMLANRTMLEDAVRQLMGPSIDAADSADYLGMTEAAVEVTALNDNGDRPQLLFEPRDFVWSPSDPGVGVLKLSCKGIACSVMSHLLREGRWEPMEPLSAKATLLSPCGGSANQKIFNKPISVQHSAYRSIRGQSLATRRVPPTCQNFAALPSFVAKIGNANCSIRLHQSAGSFYLEPLLCYQPAGGSGVDLRRDFNRQLSYLRLDILLRSEEALRSANDWLAKNRLVTGGREPNATYLKLLDPRPTLRGWPASGSVGRLAPQVRLGADEAGLLLRVPCGGAGECAELRSALEADPLVLFSRIGWRPVFLASGGCRIDTDGLRLSVPLTNPPLILKPAQASPEQPNLMSSTSVTCGGSGACQFVSLADGRSFLVAQQRKSPGISFAQNWTEYEEGFGDSENFWIGLRSMSALTRPFGSLMRIEARLWNGSLLYAEYSGFRLAGPGYNLTYNSYLRRQSNTGPDDLLSSSKNMQFSTQDRLSRPMQSVYNYHPYYGHQSGAQLLRSLGYAGWWWNHHRIGQQYGNVVDFNPNGLFHFSDALPGVGIGDPRQQHEARSFMGLNRTVLIGCTWSKVRKWTPLKEVRLLIEV